MSKCEISLSVLCPQRTTSRPVIKSEIMTNIKSIQSINQHRSVSDAVVSTCKAFCQIIPPRPPHSAAPALTLRESAYIFFNPVLQIHFTHTQQIVQPAEFWYKRPPTRIFSSETFPSHSRLRLSNNTRRPQSSSDYVNVSNESVVPKTLKWHHEFAQDSLSWRQGIYFRKNRRDAKTHRFAKAVRLDTVSLTLANTAAS